MDGKVQTMDTYAEYNYSFKIKKVPIEFSLSHEYVSIKNTTPVQLPAHLVGLSTNIEATLPFFNFDKMYFRFGASPSYYGDNWTMYSTRFRMPSRYFAIYQPNEKWLFVAGLAVFPDESSLLLPIAGFAYTPNEKWAFNFIPKRPNITYNVNKRLHLYLEGEMTDDEYVVTKDERKHTVLNYQEMHVGTGLEYDFNKYITCALTAGYMFNRRLQYRDSLGKVSIDSCPYTEFRVEMQI
jgi:hypothetical protein